MTTIKVILTNWINILGIFAIVYIYSFLHAYSSTSFNVVQALLSSLILVALYGIVFWVGLIITIAILDSLLIKPDSKNLVSRLVIEWALISSIFLYWTVKYQEWIFLAGIIAFLITQLLRKRSISKIVP